MTALPATVTPVSADSYQQFIASKLQLHIPVGFAPSDLSGYSLDSPRILAAAQAARSARFEHGESPL